MPFYKQLLFTCNFEVYNEPRIIHLPSLFLAHHWLEIANFRVEPPKKFLRGNNFFYKPFAVCSPIPFCPFRPWLFSSKWPICQNSKWFASFLPFVLLVSVGKDIVWWIEVQANQNDFKNVFIVHIHKYFLTIHLAELKVQKRRSGLPLSMQELQCKWDLHINFGFGLRRKQCSPEINYILK